MSGLAIPVVHIDAAIRALQALRAKPQMDGFDYLAMLRCIDAIEGRDALLTAISDCESELGLDDSECLACGSSSCGCDQAYEDWASLAPVTRIGPNTVAA